MQIDDTFIVTQYTELATPESPHQALENIAQAIKGMTQNAAAFVAKERPQHRVFALSVSPLVMPCGDKEFLSLTAIIAIVPKSVVSGFPWAKGLTS